MGCGIRPTLVLALSLILMCAEVAIAGATDPESPSVNYVSSDAVYLNVGRRAGLTVGARVEVVRDGRTIAVLKVTHISSHSAACEIVEQTDPPRSGDKAVFVPAAAEAAPRPAAFPDTVGAAPVSRPAPTENVVSGYVGIQNVWQQDLTGSNLSSLQPAITARVRVDNVGGSGGELRFRDRVRYYLRDQPAGPTIAENEWYHRLTELAFVMESPGATIGWGVGRFIAPYMLGVGLIDGGYVSVGFARYFRAGVAAGLTPDPYDLGVSADGTQAGGFIALDYEVPRLWRFNSSAALTGRYHSGTVSREFVYWQNAFNYYNRLSVFQTVEIDLNRDWRRDTAGGSATFSNFYLNANAELTRNASVDFAYDSRKNVRVYETKEIPDSLFDDLLHQGFRGGLTLRLPKQVTLRGYGGIRYRDGDRTNHYFSIYARSARLPWSGHGLWLRYAFAETRTVTGHRPAAEYRFPAGRHTRLSLGAGGYIYQQGTRTTSNAYGDVGAYYSIRRYYLSGKYRQYFGGTLESILFFAEVGLRL
ncbi:MAG: hypothetical protein PVF33_03200 [Candidatus Latescibacterota bacterium]|jgi:hypothetical protein